MRLNPGEAVFAVDVYAQEAPLAGNQRAREVYAQEARMSGNQRNDTDHSRPRAWTQVEFPPPAVETSSRSPSPKKRKTPPDSGLSSSQESLSSSGDFSPFHLERETGSGASSPQVTRRTFFKDQVEPFDKIIEVLAQQGINLRVQDVSLQKEYLAQLYSWLRVRFPASTIELLNTWPTDMAAWSAMTI